MTPTLSIIVPLLNEAGQLPGLLTHLLIWRSRGCEVILVDGGSTDGSLAMIEASGLSVLSAPRGRAREMNAGAAKATGDVLLFLHGDTRLCENADTLVRNALAKGKKVWGRFDVRIAGDHWLLPVIGCFMNNRSRLTGIATGDQAIFVAKETFNALGGFADIPLMEDIELSKRLRRVTAPACLRQKVTTSGRRWQERGVWKTILLMWRLRWAYWRGTPVEKLAERYP